MGSLLPSQIAALVEIVPGGGHPSEGPHNHFRSVDDDTPNPVRESWNCAWTRLPPGRYALIALELSLDAALETEVTWPTFVSILGGEEPDD